MKNVVLSYLEKIEITLIFFIKLNTVGKFNEKKRCASKIMEFLCINLSFSFGISRSKTTTIVPLSIVTRSVLKEYYIARSTM